MSRKPVHPVAVVEVKKEDLKTKFNEEIAKVYDEDYITTVHDPILDSLVVRAKRERDYEGDGREAKKEASSVKITDFNTKAIFRDQPDTDGCSKINFVPHVPDSITGRVDSLGYDQFEIYRPINTFDDAKCMYLPMLQSKTMSVYKDHSKNLSETNMDAESWAYKYRISLDEVENHYYVLKFKAEGMQFFGIRGNTLEERSKPSNKKSITYFDFMKHVHENHKNQVTLQYFITGTWFVNGKYHMTIKPSSATINFY